MRRAVFCILTTMNVYVAGKNIDRARKVMTVLREAGHTITFDWLVDIESETNPVQKALDEREGIRLADALVYLWEPNQESARYEAGMAMGLGKPVIVSGSHESWFFSLPEVMCVVVDAEILQALSSSSAKKDPA